MRTKEFVIEMCPEDLRMFESKVYTGIYVYHDGHTVGGLRPLKAKLIIPEPERKVEITESQFDEAFKGCDLVNTYFVKEKLFGEQP